MLVGSRTLPILLLMVGFVGPADATPRTGEVAQAPGARVDVVEGKRIFETVCASCHGGDGQGGGAVPRLQAYPAGAERRFIEAVLEGRNSLGMPPWRGLLSEAQIRSILAYVRALVPSAPISTSSRPEEQARQVFSQVCATCHGPRGRGTGLGPDLHAFAGSDAEFAGVVLNGRPGTAMAPFESMVSREVARMIRGYLRDLGRL